MINEIERQRAMAQAYSRGWEIVAELIEKANLSKADVECVALALGCNVYGKISAAKQDQEKA